MIAPSQVQVEGEERISDGYLKVTRYLIRHEQYDGSWTQTLSREVMERGEVAAVLHRCIFLCGIHALKRFRKFLVR